VEIAAPGVDILSTIPNGYAFASGTSMACPHVAGVAAQIWSRFPECTNTQIRNVLLRTAKHVGECVHRSLLYEGCYNVGVGSGLVQSKAAYDLLAAEGCEAGGDVLSKPSDIAVGGCLQNPDFVEDENSYYKICPQTQSASNLLLVSSLALGLPASLLMWLL
jgi:hypothetical protein